jgi:hypothetical protein
MLAVKQGQRDGDVLVFDAQQRPVARAALEDGADPLIIDALGDNTAVVGDFSLIKLHHIDAQGRNLGEFGDTAFRGELKPLRERVRTGALWKTGAMVGGGVVIVLGLVLGLLFGEKPKRPGQFDSRAKVALAELSALGKADTTLRYPLVLQQTEAYAKAARKQMLGVGVASVLMIALAVAMPTLLRGNLENPLGNWKLACVLLLGIVVPSFVFWLVWRELLQPAELRVTEHRLGWVKGARVVCAAPLKDVYASTNALLIGSKIVRFRVPARRTKVGEAMFDMALFNRAVVAHLPPDHLVDDQALVWQSIKNRPLAQRLLLCALVIVGLLVSFYPLFRSPN